VSHGTLTASVDAENQRLQQAIRSVVSSTNATGGTLRGADLCLTRPSGKRPLQVVITPLSPGQQREGRRPAAALIVFDPENELEVSLKRCTDIFGFTRAEAQVALGVMRGHSLERISAVMGNTVATSRNLLKRVYLKAGVNRQNELTRLMFSSPLFFDPSSLQLARLESPPFRDDSISH
jgi:DNA-binding CsgD family transcriptional regulator